MIIDSKENCNPAHAGFLLYNIGYVVRMTDFRMF